MAKAKFPGRATKFSNRKRVLSSELINFEDFDGFRAAEDAYCRLSVFDFLFPDENEGSLFHGFSPHDIQVAKLQYDGYVKERSASSSTCDERCQSVSETQISGNGRKSQNQPFKNVSSSGKEVIKRTPVAQLMNGDGMKRIGVCSNPAAAGKFVLPSRSAHSSRVIKPNKRFLENVSPDRTNKRSRGDDQSREFVFDSAIELDNSCATTAESVAPSVSPSKDKTPHSPVKFVLQKPKLKIDSEPFSPVEGPFSSQSSPPLEKLKGSRRPPTKVVCGVCGSMWYFKQVRLARKYGIFSCDPCRKFIMKTLKAHEAKSVGTLSCSTKTGNCVIRQFTLGSCIPFSTEKPPENVSSRCQACWLNLCLHSYHLPSEVLKGLSKYLPPEIKDRPVVESESKKSGLRSSADYSQKTLLEKGESKEEREVIPAKANRGKIKLPLVGPRVKHVCRSASLVLGQPVAATFEDKNCAESDSGENFKNGNPSGGIGDELLHESNDASIEAPLTVAPPVYGSGIADYDRPKARMLQDLGRDNCDLLYGMEKYELERKFAKVSIDFWESYDPEEVTLAGFPLIGYNTMNIRALCFLCGSAGLEKLVHCSNCCEAYHTFCVSTLRTNLNKKEWWRLDWFCPKCTECRSCSKPGGTQLLCGSCHASYHSNCVTSGRANVMDGTWMCPCCLHCKSCKDPEVHVFVGNVPLCKLCFKLRKKGNFCPLCQVCYDENDYDTKMMECAECKRWIHAKCEKISDETYQILSYLPSSIEFICRHCCKEPPPLWKQAVSVQLKVGLLNVIKALSKNKEVCNLLKASPMKKSCSCRNYLHKPILLKNISNTSEPAKAENEQVEDKCSDLGLLTPKLTKDDEECLESAKVNLVTNKLTREDNPAVYDFTEDVDDLPITRFEQNHSLNLLSIVGWPSNRSLKVNKPSKSPSSLDVDSLDRKCSCEKHDSGILQSPLSIMEIKKKIQSNQYLSLRDFNRDMIEALEGIHLNLTNVYLNSLKQVFPWFDSNNPGELSFNAEVLDDAPNLYDSKADVVVNNQTDHDKKDLKSDKGDCTWKDLLVHEPGYYYINSNVSDLRTCMFCKAQGEGNPSKEGRLVYCGHNEWVHLNCALWSSEVFEEIDGSLQNVHSAISRARMIRCFSCGKKGASVGCCARSCPSAYHLSCALEANCVFLANKEVYCKNHTHLRGSRDLHDPKDFYVSRAIHVELDPKKKKEVLHSDVRLSIGSLSIQLIGEVLPEYSDAADVIIPCNFKCSRLFWSAEEPWRLVRYFIETRVEAQTNDCSADTGINFTIDHSLEFTPPPSPIDHGTRASFKCLSYDKDVRNLLTQMVDTVCAREEDSNLADQQNADLLPPDVKEAIFEDLPHEILDGILMHDIFAKMNFDDFAECRIDKVDMDVGETPTCLPKKSNKEDKTIKPSSLQKSTNVRRYVGIDCDFREPEYKWKSSNIVQLDGAVDDSSDSDSVDSNEVCTMNGVPMMRDEPVKCDRCRRTYRTSFGYERHLPSCDSDFSSESNSSEDVKIVTSTKQEQITELEASMQIVEHAIEEFVEPSDSSSEVSSCDTQMHGVEMIVDLYQDCVSNQTNDHSVSIEELQDVQRQRIVEPRHQPAIYVQQIPQESVIPQYVSAYSQQPAIQQPGDIQYFNSGSSSGYYQTQLAPTVLPTVQPTVVGTIVQSGGVDQIVLNQPPPNLDTYSQPTNGIYITNTPMLVGMETVVSNTVMSSSQFLPGMPGMMASSYSATTTQVFHAAKPQIEIPHNYVVVNAQPVQPVMNQTPTNLPAIMPNSVQPSNPWDSYTINIPDSYKMGNISSSYQTVTTKIIHEHKNVDGVKMYNSTQETIVIEPVSPNNALQQHSSCTGPIRKNVQTTDVREPVFEKVTPSPKPSQPKVVELPRMPSVNREKPQQAVAPVVIKKVAPPVEKVLPQKKEEVAPKSCEKKYPVVSNRTVVSPVEECQASVDKVISSGDRTPPEAHHLFEERPKSEESSAAVIEETMTTTVAPIPCNGAAQETEDDNSPGQPEESHRHPKITYQIRSEDGFTFVTSNLQSAWNKVFSRVQLARKAKGLPPLSKNPFADPGSVLKKALGLGNNGVKYIVEQLPGVSSCANYNPVYHKKKQSALEFELSRKPKENYSGCARTEQHEHVKWTYDMFSWLASRHRRPPKLANCENDILNSNGRRTMSLPMAMRFRHLKETSKVTIGVFRSDIHGRGLFALRDIDSGEMVIEYAGEVIRSSLTDKREKYYTAKGIGCYMFRIDDQSVVDATMKGNAARFINHSCDPNCFSKVVDILGKKHILIFALRKIIQGEELTYDYKFPLEEEKINCHCLSKKCRKYLN